MGRGVMEPEYRGATARRMMREAQENAALYAKDTERVMAQRDEARAERDALKAKLTEAERLIAADVALLDRASERIAEDDATIAGLSDILNEQTAALVAAHKSAMDAIHDAEARRKEATEEE